MATSSIHPKCFPRVPQALPSAQKANTQANVTIIQCRADSDAIEGAAIRPRAEARVVLDAILEVRTAVVYATFAALLVFFPILALSGVAGRLFGRPGQCPWRRKRQ